MIHYFDLMIISTNDLICTMCIKMFYFYSLKCDVFPQFKLTFLPKAGFPKVLFESTITSFPLVFFLSLDRRWSPLWVTLDGGWWEDATRMRIGARGRAAEAQQSGQVKKRRRKNPRNFLQNKSPAGE